MRRGTFVIDTEARDNRFVLSLVCSYIANRNRGFEGDGSEAIGLDVVFVFGGIIGNAPR